MSPSKRTRNKTTESEDTTTTDSKSVAGNETPVRSSRRSGRLGGDEILKCPYCDYAETNRAIYLAHVKNEHPGMKVGIKKEPEEEPAITIVRTPAPERAKATPSTLRTYSPPKQGKPRGRPRKRNTSMTASESSEAPQTPKPIKSPRQPPPKKAPPPPSPRRAPSPRKHVVKDVVEPPVIDEEPLEPPPPIDLIEEIFTDVTVDGVVDDFPILDEKPPTYDVPITTEKRRGRPPKRVREPEPEIDVQMSPPPTLHVTYGEPLEEVELVSEEMPNVVEGGEIVEEETIDDGDFLMEFADEIPEADLMEHDLRPRRSTRKSYANMEAGNITTDEYGVIHKTDEDEDLDVDYASGAEYDEIDVMAENDAENQMSIQYSKEMIRYDSERRKELARARPSRYNPLGDPNGRYPCYIETCKWRGNFRSVRCTHMRNSHPDWIRPPRFVLNRIAKDGTVLPANDINSRYACFIEGCPWRGNYRASRSNHMKTQHKGWVPKRTRAANGGFVPNGRYHCHVEECGWRGMSRSTRAVHMRREHPGFVNPIYTPRNIPCTDCGAAMTSHKLFVDHMVVEHKIGGIVQREFTDARDYEDWFEAVQESFSIDFIKKMGVKNGPNYQILYLYCARSGGYCPTRGYDRKLDPMGMYEPRHAKQRKTAKCGKNCAAFLRVMHWTDGRLSIIGCVEHTGHRLGTALLRLSPIEREAMDEYLYMMDEQTPLDFIVDRLREIEGFTADGYQPLEHPLPFTQQFILEEDEKKSLALLLRNEEILPTEHMFGVITPSSSESGCVLTFGFMDDTMCELWKEYAGRGVCIEEVRLMLGDWDLHVFMVLVLDAENSPRIAALYVTHGNDKRPLLDHLASVWAGEITTFVTDCSEDYPELLDRYFGEYCKTVSEIDYQFAEWHLLAEWATNIDALVQNKVDKYGIICVLRRLLRTNDAAVFEQTVNELFEGLREMQLDEVAQFVDNQLEPSFLKRWTPLQRNPLTEHNNPALEYTCRMLRDRFLSCEQCTRIDEYVGMLVQRVKEFNLAELSAIYATREPDPPRELPHIYMEHAIETGAELAQAHDLDDEDHEAWATFGQPAPVPILRHHPLHAQPRYVHVESTSQGLLDKCETVISAMDLPSTSRDKLPEAYILPKDGHGEVDEIIEEVVEEEVVQFDNPEIINQLVNDGEFEIEDEYETVGSSGRRVDKRQRLFDMVAMLQEKLETMADDECIELVEGSLEQVVNKLKTVSPRK